MLQNSESRMISSLRFRHLLEPADGEMRKEKRAKTVQPMSRSQSMNVNDALAAKRAKQHKLLGSSKTTTKTNSTNFWRGTFGELFCGKCEKIVIRKSERA